MIKSVNFTKVSSDYYERIGSPTVEDMFESFINTISKDNIISINTHFEHTHGEIYVVKAIHLVYFEN